jgi:hypothetical protein
LGNDRSHPLSQVSFYSPTRKKVGFFVDIYKNLCILIFMKIDLTAINPESFMVHQHFVGGHECYLVQPIHIGATWTRDNLIFRSSLWDKEGYPVSLSFKKFFNWDEKPDLDTPPSNLNGAQLMEKLDGSTLIFSRYKGVTIIRTRGTSDARLQDNGYEVDYLCDKYAAFIKELESRETDCLSYVFEWLSPTNRIVLNYGDEPDMALVAIINHDSYEYANQCTLDDTAKSLGLRRPRTFNYNSIAEMKQSIEELRDQEGICVYYNQGQSIRKVKSAHYLYLHRAKSEISSIEKVIDVYIDLFMTTTYPVAPTYPVFFQYLTDKFDFEIATMAQGHASRICDAMKEVNKIMAALVNFASSCRTMEIGGRQVELNYKQMKKSAAEKVTQAYGSTGRASIIFKMLDGKVVGADDWKKLLYQVLK